MISVGQKCMWLVIANKLLSKLTSLFILSNQVSKALLYYFDYKCTIDRIAPHSSACNSVIW